MNRGLSSTYRALARAQALAPVVLVTAEFDSGTINLFGGNGTMTIGGVEYTGAGSLLGIAPSGETQNLRANGASISLTGLDTSILSLALNQNVQGRPVNIKLAFLQSDSIPFIEISVKVASGKFVIENISQDSILLNRGETYCFDQSDSTNNTHNLRVSTTSDGTHGGGDQYTSGWTEVGTAGTAGAYNQFVVPSDAPDTLYYYCQNHSGMGGSISISSERAALNPMIIFDGFMDTMNIVDQTSTAIVQIAAESALISLQRPKVRRYTDEDQKIDHPTDDGFNFVPTIQDKLITWGNN